MRHLVISMAVASIVMCLFGCKNYDGMKTYTVLKVNENDNIPNSLDDSLWEKANVLDEFSQPWRSEPMQETIFRALHTNEYLYLRYDVKDTNLVIYDGYQKKRDIIRSDRVEIFIRKDEELKNYYCLEVDPNGAILDFAASHYRIFDDNWTWPKGHLFTVGKILKDGYRLDMVISKQSLRDLGLLKEGILEAGIFRADTDELPDAKNPDNDFKWITWVDPKTKDPDFHVPTSFGQLLLSE
ncbi:carbohydrate-binding family 9-like protein [Flagellimonas sp. 2504JD1-5]